MIFVSGAITAGYTFVLCRCMDFSRSGSFVVVTECLP
jgi:hypothetical protein